MIDKFTFQQKFAHISKASLLLIIDVSLERFPEKASALISFIEKKNIAECLFYTINIRESFAYIFHDMELNRICHHLSEASEMEDYRKMDEISIQFSAYMDQFINDLKILKNEISLNH